MKTTQKVIDNLKNKIADGKLEVNTLYNKYIYKSAISETVDMMVGPKPNYFDINNLPYVGS
jgi:hypothetical protein